MITIINPDDIPADLTPGTYCCRVDKSSTMREIRLRFVTPPEAHVPGDCLAQVVKRETGPVEMRQAGEITAGDTMREVES